MTLDSYRKQFKPVIDPFVDICVKAGLTPNGCTILALLAAIGSGYAFYSGNILFGTVGVILNAFFDAIDGAIARATNNEGIRGDFLDHVLDRYADIFIIGGIFMGPLCSWQIGVIGLTGVLMSSYLGTQAQAVGIGRFYGGILGRADRLLLLIIIGFISLLYPSEIYGLTLFAWLILIFGILGHYTAIQRFVHVWKQLP